MGSRMNFVDVVRDEVINAKQPALGSGLPLTRQNSVFSLTFDEFQNSWGGGIGKDFGSMNMDELLKNIWTAEESHSMMANNTVMNSGGGLSVGVGGEVGGCGLQRQGSIALPRTISQKRVDDVWKELMKEEDDTGASGVPQRQQTLGEMPPMASLRCIRELSRRAMTVLSISQTCLISSIRGLELSGTSITHAAPIQNRSLTWDFPWYSRSQGRHFASKTNDTDESSDGEDEDEEDSAEMEVEREYSPAEKVEAAAEIGYKVMGPLKPSERLFKPYEPVFAVVQIGSHQFKVSNGDSIFTEKLKFCDINDKLTLTKVLLLGSASQTIIGRPILPDATVHALVEEHALDEKVLIFKKKRRKNYRRTTGHRQELTKLRITDIQGIEKPEPKIVHKPSKAVDTEQPEAELVG